HREAAARRLQRQPLEPPHQAALRDQPAHQALLARGRAALDHAADLRARDAPDRQAGPVRGDRRAARPRREDLIARQRAGAAELPRGGPRRARDRLRAGAAKGPALALLAGVWLAGCPAPRRPAPPPATALTLEIGRDGGSLRGVAGDADATYTAVTSGEAGAERTVIEARRGAPEVGTNGAAGDRRRATVAWRAELDGGGGPLVRSGALVVAAIAGTVAAGGVSLRGSPGAIAIGLDAATGTVRWRLAIDSSEWAVITAACPAGDGAGGVLLGGSFGGTLRAGARVVSSGGVGDGFVARVSAAGEVGFLIRVGGPGPDAVHGVAAAGDRLALAGTFSAGADLLGAALPAFDPQSLAADGFVAELDARAARPRWTATFGGKLDDAVAGV